MGLREPQDGGELEVRRIDQHESLVAARVPSWSCNPDGRVCLSAVTAMFDEISTVAGCAAWDRSMRTGLSVQLFSRAHRSLDVGSGDKLVFTTKLRKIGKTLGFVDGEVATETGVTLANMRHIKFMPMGSFYAFIAHPLMQPTTLAVLNAFLSLRPLQHDRMPQSKEELFPLRNLRTEGSSSFADTSITDRHATALGGIHGGAGVMLLTRMAAAGAERDLTLPIPIRSISTNLINSVPTRAGRETEVELESSLCLGSGLPDYSYAMIKKEGRIMMDSSIFWGMR